MPNSRSLGRVFGWPTNAVGLCGARKRPKKATATRMPTRISPMRVRHKPSAERSSRVVGWCAAGLSGMAATAVSAIALTGAS